MPALILIFCAAAYFLTTDFERMPPILKRGIQPSDFPQLIAGLIAGLTILMMLRDPVITGNRISRVNWATIGLLPVFAILTAIDFFLALAVTATALAVLWGERRGRILLLVGVAVPVAVFLLFDQLFRIRFPRGILTSLWYG